MGEPRVVARSMTKLLTITVIFTVLYIGFLLFTNIFTSGGDYVR